MSTNQGREGYPPYTQYYVDLLVDERERFRADRGELLMTLKTLVGQLDEWEQAVQSIVGKRKYPWGELEEARRLIAKAEGG